MLNKKGVVDLVVEKRASSSYMLTENMVDTVVLAQGADLATLEPVDTTHADFGYATS